MALGAVFATSGLIWVAIATGASLTGELASSDWDGVPLGLFVAGGALLPIGLVGRSEGERLSGTDPARDRPRPLRTIEDVAAKYPSEHLIARRYLDGLPTPPADPPTKMVTGRGEGQCGQRDGWRRQRS
jgi:hypothetical protein